MGAGSRAWLGLWGWCRAGTRWPTRPDPDLLPADVAFLGTGAQHIPACGQPYAKAVPAGRAGSAPVLGMWRHFCSPPDPQNLLHPHKIGPGALLFPPSPSWHLATLGLVAQTSLEQGPALIWVQTRAILVVLPPSQPLRASLCIVFPVLFSPCQADLAGRTLQGRSSLFWPCCGCIGVPVVAPGPMQGGRAGVPTGISIPICRAVCTG